MSNKTMLWDTGKQLDLFKDKTKSAGLFACFVEFMAPKHKNVI